MWRHIKLSAIFYLALTAQAQVQRARIVASAGAREKCVAEIYSEVNFEVEIRGEVATFRATEIRAYRNPQLETFECTAPLPANPVDFRFAPAIGNLTQALVRDPRQTRGAATIRVDDLRDPRPRGERCRFEISWRSSPLEAHDDTQWTREREEWARGDWRSSLFERIGLDLEHIVRFSLSGDQDAVHLDRIRKYLKSSNVKEVRNALSKILNDARLTSADRAALEDDSKRLQELKDHG